MAVLLVDALVVRCVLLPASLELLGPLTWRLPGWLESRLSRFEVEGTIATVREAWEPALETPVGAGRT